MNLGAADVQRVGINVSGLLFSGGYTRNNQFGLSLDYAQTVRRVVAAFHAMPGVEVHLISHVIEPQRPVEDDAAAAKRWRLISLESNWRRSSADPARPSRTLRASTSLPVPECTPA